MSTRLGMAEHAGRIEGDPVVACTLGVQPGRGLGCVRAESGPAPTPSPPPCTDCGRWLHVIRYMSIHVILACMNRAVRAVLSLDATAWRSPALCVRLESAANDVLRDPVPLPAPPRPLPPFCYLGSGGGGAPPRAACREDPCVKVRRAWRAHPSTLGPLGE